MSYLKVYWPLALYFVAVLAVLFFMDRDANLPYKKRLFSRFYRFLMAYRIRFTRRLWHKRLISYQEYLEHLM